MPSVPVAFRTTMLAALAGTAVLLQQADAARVLAKSALEAEANASVGFPPLCAKAVVDETCEILDEKYWTFLDIVKIKDALSATRGAVVRLWKALGIHTQHLQCDAFCETLVNYLKHQNFVVPPTSDVGCYEDSDGQTKCDLDLTQSFIPPEEELPDFHAGEAEQPAKHEEDHADEEAIDYTPEQLAVRVANLFRIYPELPISIEDVEGGPSALLQSNHTGKNGKWWSLFSSPPWREQLQVLNQKAQAYVSNAIRKVLQRTPTTKGVLTQWFGRPMYADDVKEVLRVLNSVDKMLAFVDYVYPGDRCSPETYAYVYPGAHQGCAGGSESSWPCTTTDNGKFVFYMCPLTMKSKESVQIETLVHEGSHHATAYTTDVAFMGGTAYGRRTCQKLAQREHSLALKNADNYCYFVQDINQESSWTWW